MSRKNWGAGGAYLRNRIWWIHYSVNGRAYNESSKSMKESDARKLLKQRLAEAARGELLKGRPSACVGDLLDLVLDDYRDNHKNMSWAGTVVNTHLRPFFQNMHAASVGSDEIRAYIKSRKDVGRATATINNELALLRRAYSLGMKTKPPKVTAKPPIPKLKTDNVRSGFFEHDEFLKMREALPPEIRPVLEFAYWTGCRRGEILNLKWPQVDLGNRAVRLNPGETKNKQSRVIPLVGDVVETLTRLKQEREENWPDSKWVFSRGGHPIIDFRAAWQKAIKASGVTRLFHDLRRTGVRNLVRSGVPEKVAMLISGHKTRSIFDRYHIVDERDLHEAARRLEESMKR